MRLRTQLSLAFLLLAILPLAVVTLIAYATSRQAYRSAVEEESRRLANDMRGRLEQAVGALSEHIERLRTRPRDHPAADAFERARTEAIVAAQQDALRSLLNLMLSESGREQGGIPFAIDSDGQLYAPTPADVRLLHGLGLAPAPPGSDAPPVDPRDWVVVSEKHAATGATIGVAHPLGPALRQIRRTAAQNLLYGLGVGVLALLGIVPLSRGLTRPLAALTEGVQRMSRGELDVQVAVPRGAELGKLASAFNQMAKDLQRHQQRMLEQERMRKELELSRRIQEELLPRQAVRLPFAEVAGASIPAREVGGDFYNYFPLPNGEAAVLVGDVSGKGVPAALLMANLQATLRARLAHERDLARLAEQLDRELAGDEDSRSYVTLFLATLDGRSGRLRYVNAGHATQLLVRRTDGIERLESTGRPLGLYPGGGFEECELFLGDGDTLFLFTDGLVDAEDPSGEPFGSRLLEPLLSAQRDASTAELLARVQAALDRHRGRTEPSDDATMVALRLVRDPPA